MELLNNVDVFGLTRGALNQNVCFTEVASSAVGALVQCCRQSGPETCHYSHRFSSWQLQARWAK